VTAFRWLDPLWLRADEFAVRVIHTPCPGAPLDGAAAVARRRGVRHVSCGETHTHWAGHWAHLAEVLFGCWGFFQQHPDAQWHLLKAHDREPRLERANDVKMRAKLRHLRLNITVDADVPRGEPCSAVKVVLRRNRTARDGHRGREGALGFLSSEAAASLRDALLGWQEESADPRLVVGILGRRRHRRLTNIRTVSTHLRRAHPTARIEELEDMDALPSMQQQCQWVNAQHVIISVHGAQLTNLVCAAPCAVLLELYPDRYFIPGYYQPLARAMGMEPFGMYLARDPYSHAVPCMEDERCRTAAQSVTHLTVPSAFINLFPVMLRMRAECCRRLEISHCPTGL